MLFLKQVPNHVRLLLPAMQVATNAVDGDDSPFAPSPADESTAVSRMPRREPGSRGGPTIHCGKCFSLNTLHHLSFRGLRGKPPT